MKILENLFHSWTESSNTQLEKIPQSGSNRQYFRLSSKKQKAIGVYNDDLKENIAFTAFCKHFNDQKLNVPKLYNQDLENHIYLQEDLGDLSLYKILNKKQKKGFDEELETYYKKSIQELIKMQVHGSKEFDFSLCYPRDKFDRQSILWDLNYFKYCFLKLADIKFDEQLLEDDFNAFSNYLLKIPANHFMHRDFQSRNLMIYNDEIYIIDFQGGRKGPLQYDLVSLLFQAKANIPPNKRSEFLAYYIQEANKIDPGIIKDKNTFTQNYYAIAFVRTMQVLGAYGYRGLFEKKAHFIQSIPFAIKNLEWLISNANLTQNFSELEKVWQQILSLKKFQTMSEEQNNKLTVTINSFSYKSGIPEDLSGNGGGFVFDCRSIHNPGRYEPYKKLTGRDQPVIDFLLTESNINAFIDPLFTVVDSAVQNYIERKFSNIMISFGCTGGQHRSVYSADKLANHLQSKFDVNINLNHIEQEKKNWKN